MNESESAVCYVHGVGGLPCATALAARPQRQAREDREYYVPNLLAERDFPAGSALYRAAERNTRRLQKAARRLDDALNLAEVLRASMCDAGDSRALHVDTVMRIVEKKLARARAELDRHEADHINLFLAYFASGKGSDHPRQR